MADATVYYTGPIVTREEARRSRLPRYFPGTKCPQGHVAQRHTVNGRCIACLLAYKLASKDKVREAERKWRSRNRERLRKKHRDYYAKNPERCRAKGRRHYAKHPEKLRAKTRAYFSKHPEVAAAQRAKRRARIAGCRGEPYSAEDVMRIHRLQRGRCAACRLALGKKYHVDHVIPIVKGGDNTRRNLQLLHPKCNLAKHAKDPVEFMQSLGYLI